jgi:hypothetical protein
MVLFIAIGLTLVNSVSCQKELKLKYDTNAIKQVIISNFTPNNYLSVNISKSKTPDDFNSVEFLNNCSVQLFEDGIFKENMLFVLKDTLSGLGSYKSSFKLKANKTYKIISIHPTLGTTSAEEYLPSIPNSLVVTLLDHADTSQPTKTGKYNITFQDETSIQNYYTIAAYYKVLTPVIDSFGDTSYKTNFIYNIPSYTPEIPNTINYGRSFFPDITFNGQLKSYIFSFLSTYNNFYKEISLVVEFANVGPSYFEWYYQQLPKNDQTFNDGQNERINLSTNVINGYGHFSGFSVLSRTIRIK